MNWYGHELIAWIGVVRKFFFLKRGFPLRFLLLETAGVTKFSQHPRFLRRAVMLHRLVVRKYRLGTEHRTGAYGWCPKR